jgi:hypothetical protein
MWGYFNGMKTLTPLTVTIPMGEIKCIDFNSDNVAIAVMKDNGSTHCVVFGNSPSIHKPSQFPFCPQFQNIPLMDFETLELPTLTEFEIKKELKNIKIVGSLLLLHHDDGTLMSRQLNSNECMLVRKNIVKIDSSRNSLIASTACKKALTWTGISSAWKPQTLKEIVFSTKKQILHQGCLLEDVILKTEPLVVDVGKEVVHLAAGWDEFIIATK